jgi:hypothetical protein
MVNWECTAALSPTANEPTLTKAIGDIALLAAIGLIAAIIGGAL